MSRKDALLEIGSYVFDTFGAALKQTSDHGWFNTRDATKKMNDIAKAYHMEPNEFYLFTKYKLRLFDAVTPVNTHAKQYFISVIDVLRTIGQLRKEKGDPTARKFINKYTNAKTALRKMIVLAGAALDQEFINVRLYENPKSNVFIGRTVEKDIPILLVESNKTKADDILDKMKKKGMAMVLMKKPEPGSTKYNTCQLVLE
jgi:NAD-dependent SIR2 family protein deacetylase